MDGDIVDIKEFLRESIEKNELEAKSYLMEERLKNIRSLSQNNGLPPLFKKKTFQNYNKNYNLNGYNQAKLFTEKFPHVSGLLFIGKIGRAHV